MHLTDRQTDGQTGLFEVAKSLIRASFHSQMRMNSINDSQMRMKKHIYAHREYLHELICAQAD